MSSSSQVKELEALLKRVGLLVSNLLDAGEWDLARQAAEIGMKLEQKVQGHKAQRRKKRGK